MKHTEFTTHEDIVAHYGEDYNANFGAMAPPIYQTSLFVHNGQAYDYSRVSNPTLDLAEEKLAALEHGDKALLYSSGLAAITSAILGNIKSGEHIVMQRTSYGPATGFLQYLEKFGITHTLVDGKHFENIEAAVKDNTRILYLESPSSAVFEMQDLRKAVVLAKKKGIVTMIDNTWSTPIFQKPLDIGIDLSIHSCSKYIGGHSDLIAGAVIGKGEIMAKLACERTMYGNALAPTQAWLITRSLRTLPVRMAQHYKNAMEIASFLENHPKVTKVNYPGLASYPQRDLFLSQMTGGSGVMSFNIDATPEKYEEVHQAFRIFQRAVSWGGYDSLVCEFGVAGDKKREEIYGKGGLFRLSVGLESTDMLKEDLEQALSVL